jgi:CheY-like chemotaxis protein
MTTAVKVLAGRRILVIEDEMVVAMLIEDLLAELGCEVVRPVAHLDRALTLIERETVDAAVLDVNLDGQDSYPLADALLRRGVPFVFSTGYGGDSVRETYRGHPILQKPFTKRDLAGALTETLGR